MSTTAWVWPDSGLCCMVGLSLRYAVSSDMCKQASCLCRFVQATMSGCLSACSLQPKALHT